MHIKKSLLVASFLLLVSTQVFAAPARNARYKRPTNHVGEIKFGPQIGGSLGFVVFGEYAISDKLGVQVSLGYHGNNYSLEAVQVPSYMDKNAVALVGYINLPIVLRAYPGEERQFCWLAGLRVGYVTNAKFIFGANSAFEAWFNELLGKSEDTTKVEMKDLPEQDRLSKFQVGVIGGFDYEFEVGLILGFVVGKDFITVLEAKDSSSNWDAGLSLGYNFGKFLK